MARVPRPVELPGLVEHRQDGFTFAMSRTCERRLRSRRPRWATAEEYHAERARRQGRLAAPPPDQEHAAWMRLHRRLYGRAPAGMFDEET